MHSSSPIPETLHVPGAHLFADTLNAHFYNHFSKYNYERWKPPQVRRDWIKGWVGSGEFLDIGCGGYPVSMDVPQGKVRGTGADIAPEAVHRYQHYFKEFYFFDIEKLDLSEVPELWGRFDTVVMSEVLEHFQYPEEVLVKVRKLLRPNGRLLITYPNAYSIAQCFDYYLHGGTWHRFKDFHFSHIYLVRKSLLEKLFRRAGYTITHFDFRPSNIAGDFPKEKSGWWRTITTYMPSLLGHQFFYVLEAKE